LTKFRKLQDGTKVSNLEENITLKVYTKCPSKYKLVDMETGEEYIGQDPRYNNHHWKKIDA
jgi:hypothetical protein